MQNWVKGVSMENPFVFGKTVTGNSFVNRKQEIRELSDALRGGQSVIIYSPRRYGKTSLIKKVMSILKKEGVEIFYIDMYRIASIEGFYETYSRLLLSGLKSGASKIISTLNSLLPTLNPTLSYTAPDMPSVTISAGVPVLKKTETLSELLNSVDKLMGKRNKKGCVVFDEFQEITEIEDGEMLEREMRAAFQHHKNTVYVFLGSRDHLMQKLFKDRNRPFYNFGLHFPLCMIPKEEWKRYISEQFGKGGYTADESAFDLLLKITRGHPYYTQLFCSELWQSGKESKRVDTESVKDSIGNVLNREKYIFTAVWDQLHSKDRKLLSALASEGSAYIYSKDFITRHNFGSASSIQRSVERLTEKSLIMKSEGSMHSIADPVLELWLRQRAGSE